MEFGMVRGTRAGVSRGGELCYIVAFLPSFLARLLA